MEISPNSSSLRSSLLLQITSTNWSKMYALIYYWDFFTWARIWPSSVRRKERSARRWSRPSLRRSGLELLTKTRKYSLPPLTRNLVCFAFNLSYLREGDVHSEEVAKPETAMELETASQQVPQNQQKEKIEKKSKPAKVKIDPRIVLVSNIPAEATHAELRKVFEEFGPVQSSFSPIGFDFAGSRDSFTT